MSTASTDPIAAYAAQTQAAAQPKKSANNLGIDEFLTLMTAQLRNQDPFKAMDPTQFLGQLAQFGTVSGIQEMQDAFATLSDSMRSSQVLEGASMVGREVLVQGDEIALGAEGGVRGALDIPSGATAVQINVLDAAGQLVRRMTGPSTSGLSDFSWDGMTDRGERAAPGAYTFEAIANVGGQAVSVEPLLASRVASVTLDSTRGIVLNTNDLGEHVLGDVRRVM